MIKNEFEITIGEFNIMEKTGRIGQFRRWYNLIPAKYFKSKINRVVVACSKLIEDDSLDKEIENTEEKINKIIELQELEVLYSICYTHLNNGAEIQGVICKIELTRKNRRKLKYKSDSLKYATDRIEKKWRKIESIDDINKFAKYIEFQRDKYHERFPEKKKEDNDKHYLIDVAMSYASYLGNATGITKMTIPELASTKKQATDKIEAERKAAENLKNKK